MRDGARGLVNTLVPKLWGGVFDVIVHESLLQLQPEKGGRSCSPPGRHIHEFLTRILAGIPYEQS
jgi:hypothetical protein